MARLHMASEVNKVSIKAQMHEKGKTSVSESFMNAQVCMSLYNKHNVYTCDNMFKVGKLYWETIRSKFNNISNTITWMSKVKIFNTYGSSKGINFQGYGRQSEWHTHG